MSLKPGVVLLVSVEVVEHVMDVLVWIGGDGAVHEVEESVRRRRGLLTALTLPVATSKTANRVVVP